jgi:NADPH-dependent glutamate synthase beta subunit-like oxidoreductase
MPADAVIVAFGFNAHSMPWINSHNIKLNRWDCVIAEQEAPYPFQTSNPKIFAGGDVVRGADLVVYAIDEGRQAANGMMDYMGVETQGPIDLSLAPTM